MIGSVGSSLEMPWEVAMVEGREVDPVDANNRAERRVDAPDDGDRGVFEAAEEEEDRDDDERPAPGG